ncbi:MAG: twin-arginine translocase subunit TatC [Myxococcales bacterium]|nr:twin-arginine translocase subunit TatC [Myxococcales bacterium]
MTIWEHIAELRKRLVICLVAVLVLTTIAWEFREPLLSFLVKPFADAWRAEGVSGNPSLHFPTPAAAFVAYFRVALLAGLLGSSPVMFYQLWAFVAPGLYAREKRYVIPFVTCSSLLFVGGGYFGWRLAFPIAFRYFLSLAGSLESIQVTVTPTVMMGDYIDFVMQLLLGFGLIFELPLFILFLSLAGIVNYLWLARYFRHFVLVAFIVAAVLTPPDVTSQLLMALPMIVLYTVSIGLAWAFGKAPTEGQREHYRRKDEAGRAKKKSATS